MEAKKPPLKHYFRSFIYAFEGMMYVFTHHRSFLIESFAAVGMVLLGFYVNLSRGEWMVLLVLIFMVLAAELLNTAIETSFDYFAKEHNINVKRGKDVAAAAVFLLSIGAVVVGLIIFWPYLF